jgi:RNA polymerase sigma factor (sigma-70 family)
VALAASEDPDERAKSLQTLAAVYYRPIYAHLRMKWRLPPEEAEDLAQAFFQAVVERNVFAAYRLERGRFRTFVKTCLDHLVESEFRAIRRLKRGGGIRPVDLDTHALEAELAHAEPAADPFDQEFVRSLFAAAVAALETRLTVAGKASYFKVFQRYDLCADPESRPTYAQLGRELGVATTDVTNYLHFARKELRRAVVAQLRELTMGPEELREEAAALGIDLDDID